MVQIGRIALKLNHKITLGRTDKPVIFQLIKISEHSLSPRYQDGDFVIISKIPILLRGVRPGDVVVFCHPQNGEMIKIVERVEDSGRRMYVTGLTSDSVDSRHFGLVPTSTVLGKVIFHVRS